MVVSMQKAVDSVIAFLSNEAVKIQSLQSRFLMYAALGAAKANSGSLISPYEDRLRMLGVITNDGMVDTDVIRNAMEMAFSNVGQFSALGFNFSMDDADKAIRMMEA